MSLGAARGSDGPFEARIHAVRGQPGQIETAAAYRQLLAGSAIRASHQEDDERVQAPYCLRCQPQVMGACLDQSRYVRDVLLREANAVTDNPLVFASADGTSAMVSGGNFHAELATFGARRLGPMLDNTGHIIAIELLAAAQGFEFLRPLQSSAALEQVHALVRKTCPPMPTDHYMAPDIEHAFELVGSGALTGLVQDVGGLVVLS